MATAEALERLLLPRASGTGDYGIQLFEESVAADQLGGPPPVPEAKVPSRVRERDSDRRSVENATGDLLLESLALLRWRHRPVSSEVIQQSRCIRGAGERIVDVRKRFNNRYVYLHPELLAENPVNVVEASQDCRFWVCNGSRIGKFEVADRPKVDL